MDEATKARIAGELRENFPNGHEMFVELAVDLMDLHDRKNHDYAKGGDPLGNFKRVAAILSNYPRLDMSNPAAVALVYALKQIDASLWMLSQGYEAEIEGIDPRLADVSNYANLARIILAEQKKAGEQYG